MAGNPKQILIQYDFTGIPLVNFRMQPLAANPGTPLGFGHLFFSTALLAPIYYDGSTWRNVMDRANHTGNVPFGNVSGAETTVKGYSLDMFAAPAANVSFNNKRITNLADPVDAQDAATKNYVLGLNQSAAAGVSSKAPVRLVATANVASLSGTPTVDGVALVGGDRVLLAGQSTASQNGPWVVPASGSGAWTRPTTEGTGGELDLGALWLVLDGNNFSGTQWRVANKTAITPGTTAVSIVQFAASQSISTGNGLNFTSGNLTLVLAANSGLLLTANGLAVDPAAFTRKKVALLGDGSATSFSVVHNLGTRDVQVQVYRNSAPYDTVETEASRTDANTVTIGFNAVFPANSFVAVIVG